MADKVTLSDIAKACHLSLGTVSRALNDRPDISEQTKIRVSQVAQELGYRKNGSAVGVPCRIGIVYCREEADFYSEVTAGIQRAENELGPSRVQLTLLQTEHLDQASQIELLSRLDPEQYDGLIINSAGSETTHFINNFMDQGVPVATFNTDAPTSRRLYYVGCNAYLSGQMGAYLLGKLTGGRGKVVLYGSIMGRTAWVDRFSSAYAVLHQEFPGIEIIPVSFDNQSQEEAERSMEEYLEGSSDITGIFPVNNARTGDVLHILRRKEYMGIHVVGFDLTPETRYGIQNDLCDALLYQNPGRQGYLSVISMFRYLSERQLPPPDTVSITPSIIMKYNMDSY